MASIFKKPKAPKPPPLPEPAPTLEKAGEEGVSPWRKRRGRAKTIIAGDLIPSNIKERHLIG